MSDNVELFDDKRIKKIAYELWEVVTQSANAVIFQANKYGFALIEVEPNPNIHQMLATIRGIEKLIDGIIDDSEFFGAMDHDDIRRILNAKDSLNRMQRVALSLQESNEEDFNTAVEELTRTAPF